MFRFGCSVPLRGRRGAADRYHWHVWGALTVFRPHWVCPLLTGVCFPHLHCSGSWLLSRERALCGLCFRFSGSPQKRRLGWACVLCLPHPSSSGIQELDGRALPGCSAPSPLHGPSLSFHLRQSGACACVYSWELASRQDPPGGCRPSRISGSLWLETGGLFAV